MPYYLNRKKEYFIKPTTTKNIIKYFDLKDVIYKPKPSYEFYERFSKHLNDMKKNVDSSVKFDNAVFTGFLRIAIEMGEE